MANYVYIHLPSEITLNPLHPTSPMHNTHWFMLWQRFTSTKVCQMPPDPTNWCRNAVTFTQKMNPHPKSVLIHLWLHPSLLITSTIYNDGKKSGHPGESRIFLTTNVGSADQSSRRSRHCWTSGSSWAWRTEAVTFQGKSPSLTEGLWCFFYPSSDSSSSELTWCFLCKSAGLPEAGMNSTLGSGSGWLEEEVGDEEECWIGAFGLGALGTRVEDAAPLGWFSTEDCWMSSRMLM